MEQRLADLHAHLKFLESLYHIRVEELMNLQVRIGGTIRWDSKNSQLFKVLLTRKVLEHTALLFICSD